ncbi:protein phosphatase 1 regulatory subunit 3C isoform X2 [Orussus abietinus]|uniref:protein phosphatase 1 regulatory subunit 3C isoform X2 n=1 Tax=Orussus abietinus TaxID=222816 RepID=UPI0006258B42|nr:protein phosphatase 1 regulatory subunit 3C isoform X2 [Orussus abietinus]
MELERFAMCSIAMPAELILGHSPPLYSPLRYNPRVVTATPISTRSVPPRIRPCLSTGSLSLDELHNGRRKKRVVFADDCGGPLTQVRVMSEGSNMPPSWTSAYFADLTRNITEKLAPPPWEVTFTHPASDYLTFRKKLDQQAVCLENVVVKENEHCLVGTVKVKNIAYDKEVSVRASTDSWRTYEDVYCSYVEQPGTLQPALVLYDTFRFRLTLPIKSNTVEFCVRYSIGGTEYWDNNLGSNYVVRKKQEVAARHCESLTVDAPAGFLTTSSSPGITDATRVNLQSWSEFASWSHLTNDGPYW